MLLVEYLVISCGARADCFDRSTKPPSTPISLAVAAADLVVVRRLLRAGADPSVHGLQPLLSSLSASFTACVELADALEIDVNVQRLSMMCRPQTQAIKQLVKWLVQHSTTSSSSTQQVGAADAFCGQLLHVGCCTAACALQQLRTRLPRRATCMSMQPCPYTLAAALHMRHTCLTATLITSKGAWQQEHAAPSASLHHASAAPPRKLLISWTPPCHEPLSFGLKEGSFAPFNAL